jgi:hypothetical protein
MQLIKNIENKIKNESQYSKDKSDKHGEVFTPNELINEMLDELPQEIWSDKTKTWFDPCAGKGNFPIQIIKRLMIGLEHEIEDEYERYKHIMENQIYMGEYQYESAEFIRQVFNPNNDIKINLYEGDTLNMPDNYFDKKENKKWINDFFYLLK